MYLEHYGLAELPFSLTPDTHFFVKLPRHVEALKVLKLSLQQGEGFIKIVGEVGTGKTLLCRCLLRELEPDFVTVYISNPKLTPTQFYASLANELQIKDSIARTGHLILNQITNRLIEIHSENKKVALLIDEAQALPEETLEALRLLTSLETEKTKLLQVVLFGQPELNVILKRPSLRQLVQRITFSYNLKPLPKSAVEYYLNYRLAVAGYDGLPLFVHPAISLLTDASGGIPRLINVLAHKALLVAYGLGERLIKPMHVKKAIVDTESAFQYSRGLTFSKFLGLRNRDLIWIVAGAILASMAAFIFL